ncbi:DUF2786 domain-containing protein [Streptomyces apocyni]|uniref:DUF2786 domain-containing protein n=1 Tax=Streptomyces apocyni TaxID=2654677 RepID=UPI0012EAFB7A|nr:DUF2786 domain-containing protein [Streptomyces apocyni]
MDQSEAATRAVERAFAAALYADGDDGLDLGASLLAAAPAPETGRELLRRGAEFVRRAWERGWQPADVVRLLRRELPDARHARIAGDLIAAEARRYTRLEPRWAGQLRDLDAAEPWWGADDTGYADALARRESADRFSLATAVLEVLRLLLRLPAITPVGAVPGAPVHVPPPHQESRLLTRIRALLAKAEATDFPDEAEALTAKAQELMARHSVDEALLAAKGPSGDAPAACRIGVDAPYETAKAILLDAAATANHCRAVWQEALGFSTVVGFEPDLESVELLYTSLLVQGNAAMAKAEAAQRAAGRKRTKTFRQSFLLAYAHRIGTRLSDTAARATSERAASEAGASFLPVLAARDVAVAGRTDQLFPETTATRLRGATDEAGWTHGTAAADRATGL